jgi:hypothetical protein
MKEDPVIVMAAGIGIAGLAASAWFAFGGSPREKILRIARKEVGNTNWMKYTPGVTSQTPTHSFSWCGVFALWVLKRAGLAKQIFWDLKNGVGFLQYLPVTSSPQPGDIAYINQPYQHHAIVERVDGSNIYTLDGNSEGDMVRQNVRPRSAFSAFYSIEPLIRS